MPLNRHQFPKEAVPFVQVSQLSSQKICVMCEVLVSQPYIFHPSWSQVSRGRLSKMPPDGPGETGHVEPLSWL